MSAHVGAHRKFNYKQPSTSLLLIACCMSGVLRQSKLPWWPMHRRLRTVTFLIWSQCIPAGNERGNCCASHMNSHRSSLLEHSWYFCYCVRSDQANRVSFMMLLKSCWRPSKTRSLDAIEPLMKWPAPRGYLARYIWISPGDIHVATREFPQCGWRIFRWPNECASNTSFTRP